MTSWWIGVQDAMVALAINERRSTDGVDIITEMSLDSAMVQEVRWVGIAPPPEGGSVFTLHAPIEASGLAVWCEYAPGGRYAPQCELIAVRWATTSECEDRYRDGDQ